MALTKFNPHLTPPEPLSVLSLNGVKDSCTSEGCSGLLVSFSNMLTMTSSLGTQFLGGHRAAAGQRVHLVGCLQRQQQDAPTDLNKEDIFYLPSPEE